MLDIFRAIGMYTGEERERRKQFWRCVKASFKLKFRKEVQAMSKLSKKEITEDI